MKKLLIAGVALVGVVGGLTLFNATNDSEAPTTAHGLNSPDHIGDMPDLQSQSDSFGPIARAEDRSPLASRMYLIPAAEIGSYAANAQLPQPSRPASRAKASLIAAVENAATPPPDSPTAAPLTGAAPRLTKDSTPAARADVGFHIFMVPDGTDLQSVPYTEALTRGVVDFYYTFAPETDPTTATKAAIDDGLIAVADVNGETAWVQRISPSLSQLTMWFTDQTASERVLLILHANQNPDDLLQLARETVNPSSR